jgi:sugar phosphate isomerase/epimerase
LSDFKLAVITDEVSQDLEVIAKFAKRLDLDGIEIRTLWNKNPQDLLNDAKKIKRVLMEYDLEVCAIASPFFKTDLGNKNRYEEHLGILRKCIDLADFLDTKIIRGFTFWRTNGFEDNLEKIIENYQKPLEIIESSNIILGIENEPSTYVGNGKELATFLDRLGSKKVKAIWDPGNDMSDLSGEIPYPDGYRYVKDKKVHVHIKDGVRKGEGGKPESVPVGDGEVDYYGQLKALQEEGYSGYLSLETHWRPKKKLSEEIVNKPGGREFSRFGEEASDLCMRNLQKILNRI